jgi:Uma2 family endonuclease
MKNPVMSWPEYLAFERKAGVKHEYLRGDVWAMAGGTPRHGRLASNLARIVGNALQGKPCVVYSSDVRVRIEASDRATYPDLSVVCGPDRLAADDADAITNPIVLFEVLSEGTERSDRGEKFAHYRRLESLQEYVLVNQDAARVEVFRRHERDWLLVVFEAGSTARLDSIDVSFPVDEVYADPRS